MSGPRRHHELAGLYELAVRLGEQGELAGVATAFLDWLRQTLAPAWAAFLVVDESRGVLRVVGGHGFEPELHADVPLDADPWAWFSSQGLLPHEAAPGRRYAVQIRDKDRLLGIVCAVSGRRRATRGERALLNAAARCLANALRTAHEVDQLRTQVVELAATLEQTRALFRAIMDQSVVGIALVAANGLFAQVNQGLAVMLDYSPDLLQRMHVADILHPANRAGVWQTLSGVLEGREKYTSGRIVLQAADGRAVYVQGVAFHVPYQGKPHLLAIVVDVTAQQHAEEAYHAVAERTPMGLTIFQGDEVVYVNPAFAQNIGRSPEEVQGMSVRDLIRQFVHADDAGQAEAYVTSLHGERVALQRWLFRYRRPDGTMRWAVAYGTSIRYRGAPAVLVAYIDITRQKEAEKALQRHARFLHALNRIVSQAHRAQSLQALLETCVVTLRETLHAPMAGAWLLEDVPPQPIMPVIQGLPGVRAQKVLSLIGQMLSQEAPQLPVYAVADWAEVDDPWRRYAPELLELGVRATLSSAVEIGGRVVGHLAVAFPEPHPWSEEAKILIQAVAAEVAVALERLRLVDSLRQALAAKDEMIQNVSHELRTPLTLIRGYLELMEEGALGPLTPEMKEAVAVMLKNADRQRFMIDRLLLMQQLADLPLYREPIALEPWFRDFVLHWEPVARERNVRFQIHVAAETPPVWGDRGLLSEMMDNLIHNAIKFSPHGGTVKLQAWPEEGTVMIAVADEGIGIPSGQLEKIFERFYQVSRGLSRRFEGLGIGLSLAADIVAKHGGEIWAESEGENKGATFYVRLPSALGEAQKT